MFYFAYRAAARDIAINRSRPIEIVFTAGGSAGDRKLVQLLARECLSYTRAGFISFERAAQPRSLSFFPVPRRQEAFCIRLDASTSVFTVCFEGIWDGTRLHRGLGQERIIFRVSVRPSVPVSPRETAANTGNPKPAVRSNIIRVFFV